MANAHFVFANAHLVFANAHLVFANAHLVFANAHFVFANEVKQSQDCRATLAVTSFTVLPYSQ